MGKGADSLDTTLPTSGVDVAVLPNKFRPLFRRFSRRDQNAWDQRKLCTYDRDDAVWNDFRTHFQDKQVPFFVFFGVFVKIYRYIYAGFPKGSTIVRKRSKISGLSLLLIKQGLKQPKGFSLIHFPV